MSAAGPLSIAAAIVAAAVAQAICSGRCDSGRTASHGGDRKFVVTSLSRHKTSCVFYFLRRSDLGDVKYRLQDHTWPPEWLHSSKHRLAQDVDSNDLRLVARWYYR